MTSGGNKPEPGQSAADSTKRELPKRFYKEVGLDTKDGKFVVTLDGRGAKTPGRHPLAVASAEVAHDLAAEWNAQEDVIDPATMPMTRLVNTAIDHVSSTMDEVRQEIVRYIGSDLLCYRVGEPAGLVERQMKLWDPLVDWAREELGVPINLAEGVIAVSQPPDLPMAFADKLTSLTPLRLSALHVATTITGSAIIALALLRGRLDLEEAWAAAYLDEDWQMETWGRDEVALKLREPRRAELTAAVVVLQSG